MRAIASVKATALVAVVAGLGAGCRSGPQAKLELSLAMTVLPTLTRDEGILELEVHNTSDRTQLLDWLPLLHDKPGQGDVVVTIVSEGGKRVPFDCALDEGGPRRYLPARPGQTRLFQTGLTCFGFAYFPPGIFTLSAYLLPRNRDCHPGPGEECFVGPSNTATIRLRWQNGKVSSLRPGPS